MTPLTRVKRSKRILTGAAARPPRCRVAGGLAAIPIPDQAAPSPAPRGPAGSPGDPRRSLGVARGVAGAARGREMQSPRHLPAGREPRGRASSPGPRLPRAESTRNATREPALPSPPLLAQARPRVPQSVGRSVGQSVSQSVWRSPSRRGAPGRQEAEALRPRTTDATQRLRVPGRPLASASSGRAAHSAPTPRTSLPRTPAASATYCLKPRPPPRPALRANGRAPRRRHHVVARAPPAAPQRERLTEPADYSSQDAPRERRPAARGLLGNVVLWPGELGSRAGRAALAFQVGSRGPRVRGSSPGQLAAHPILV